jgi:hypothetical protein
MSDRGALEESARATRRAFDEYHHPEVFRRTLRSIIAGQGGFIDPDETARNNLAAQSLLSALTESLIASFERNIVLSEELTRLVGSLERSVAASEELKRSGMDCTGDGKNS